jgi:hypothetical protein
VTSPFLHARFEPRLYERVLRAAEAEHVSLSAFLRMAVEAGGRRASGAVGRGP